MKVTFWLLDVNYEVVNHQPEIWIWGIDDEDRRVLILDRGFLGYFYLIPREGVSPQEVVEQILSRRRDFPLISKVEVVDRRFFGRPVKAIKVTCRDPNLIQRYAQKLRKLKGVRACLEEDIRYSMRYLIDNDVVPCSWHEVEAEEIANRWGVQVDRVYLAKSPPRKIERIQPPTLRVLGFSTIRYSERGAPKPERNPVVVISVATNTGLEKQFVASNSDDRAVIRSFIEFVREFDPDVIVGYGTNQHEWPYLTQRAKRLGIRLSVDRANTEPHTSVYGHVSITGRANVDLFDYAEDLTEVKVKTLENVAEFLGVAGKERIHIEEIDLPNYWKDPEKRPRLLEFSMQNTRYIMGIAKAMLDFAIQLSSLVGLPLDHVGTAAVGFRVEWFLIREAHRIGELVPARTPRPYIPYTGAIVLKPEPGIHENIAVLDFKSLYPNIMIAHNISPDTYLPPDEPTPPCGVDVAPEVGHRFRKEPPGLYKAVLSRLIAVRDEIRPRLKELDPESAEYRILDARQKAIKVITNATYGYAGWLGARWYVKSVAEATTAWGRHAIMNAIKLAEEEGLDVIYGDTDSIFIRYDPEKVERLSRRIREVLGLEIKPDKIYTRVLFTEAKKRYCGLLPDGRLDVVGLEVIRGDWAAVAKNVQERVLEIILKEGSPEKAVEFVRRFISDLRGRKVPYRDLIIWKTLTKPISKYEVRAPHVAAARTLMEKGWELSIGDKVGYVIVAGPGKLYERAKPYMLASYDEVDVEYYVQRQVVPAAVRILSIFNIDEKEVLPPAVADLSRFVKS